jgi:hypothetical protein
MSGKLTLISSATASGASSVEFTSGIDSTYDEYVFYFVDINPATDDKYFTFQVNASGGSGFNETMTTTWFDANHLESGASGAVSYGAWADQAQGTGYQYLTESVGNGADECCAGELHLFSPSSTSKVKHFYSKFNTYRHSSGSNNTFVAGYINTTSAIDEISFKQSSGNFDGNIYLYGVG